MKLLTVAGSGQVVLYCIMKKLEQEVMDEHDLLLKRKSAFGDSLSELKKLNEHQLSSRLKADVAELVELVEAVASFIEEEIITLKESEKVLQDKISIVATKIQLAESIKKMEASIGRSRPGPIT